MVYRPAKIKRNSTMTRVSHRAVPVPCYTHPIPIPPRTGEVASLTRIRVADRAYRLNSPNHYYVY